MPIAGGNNDGKARDLVKIFANKQLAAATGRALAQVLVVIESAVPVQVDLRSIAVDRLHTRRWVGIVDLNRE